MDNILLCDKAPMDLIIFDCDGTLVDSELLCNLALQLQLTDIGINSEATELMSKYRGGKLSEIMSSLESNYLVTLPLSFESEYRKKVSSLFDDHLKANEGVETILESLTIPFCVASSAPIKKIKHALQVTGLDKYFNQNIYSSYEIGSWKPEPGIFLHAAKMMNVLPEKCCVVEDSIVGLHAANRANMKSVYYSPDSLDHNPTGSVRIKHMSELAGIIT